MIIAHRINNIKQLNSLPKNFGVEIDVRFDNRTGRLYLNHDPGVGEDLEIYLKHFKHKFIIFNIKEAGIEQTCIDLAKKYHISKNKYFLLDVEFPYLYKASRKGFKNIAVRYSEAEPIEMTLAQKNFVDWVWIDVNTKLPLNLKVCNKLKKFKACLVSPECWGRPQDIASYQKLLKKLHYSPDAIMCDTEYIKAWDNFK